jgi:purine-nucleoside phosphorylase
MTTKAIILGSGVSVFENQKSLESIPYSNIPGWPLGKVKGHKGVLDKYPGIWVLRGRAHIYEGFTWEQACFPTRYLAEAGIKELIITNAAGGINPEFEVGDLMQITSYLNFIQPGRTRGNLEALNQGIIKLNTKSVPALRQGVYIGVHGPNYETDAEVALFRSLGADVVGMSTIPELEVAMQHNMKITAVSIITNVYGKTDDLGHEGVIKVARASGSRLLELLN